MESRLTDQRVFKGDHPTVAQGLNNVAACLSDLGRLDEALRYHVSALAMRQRLFRGDHPDVAQSLNNMGNCLRTLGRFSDALTNCEAARAMFRKVLPADHVYVQISQVSIGSILVDMNRYSEAEPMLLAAQSTIAGRADIPNRYKERVLMSLAGLYEGRNIAEPGKGYDAKAAQWRARLAEWQAATQPASQARSTLAATSEPAP